MNVLWRAFCLAGVVCVSLSAPVALSSDDTNASADTTELALTLPREIPLVVGTEFHLWFRNIAMTDDAVACRFEVQCDRGTATAENWSFTPQETDIGEHRLTIFARSANGTSIDPPAKVETTLRIVPACSLTSGNQTKTDPEDMTPCVDLSDRAGASSESIRHECRTDGNSSTGRSGCRDRSRRLRRLDLGSFCHSL